MKIGSFSVGLHLTLNNVAHRIERIYESGECILERTSDHAMITRTKTELLNSFENGALQIEGSSFASDRNTKRNEVDIASLSEEQQLVISRKREYVIEAQRILGSDPIKKGLLYVIQDVEKRLEDKNPPSVQTVYRWWNNWVASNSNILCFRDKKTGPNKAHRFSSQVQKIIDEAIEEFYLTEQRNEAQDVYDIVKFRICEINLARLTKLKIPSRSTFYRLIKSLDKFECMSARLGKDVANNHFRATGAGVPTKYILERVEVDHTPLDVMVVNKKSGLPDGRPWLTVLLDKQSRMPLGFVIGFEPPSELSVMLALRNAIIPKSYVKEKYSNIVEQWPAHGIPVVLVCDNGLEFHSKNLQRMCAELNIEIQFCPKRQPHYKGAVERFNGTLNRAVCHRIPGTTFSDIKQRGKYKSEQYARVTLAELNNLIHEWIIDIYCHEINRITGKSPYDLWQDGLQKRMPLMPESIDQLNLIVTKEITRTLSHEGVILLGLPYNSSELRLLTSRSNTTYKVKVRFDPTNMGKVWVYDEVNGDYIIVPSIYPDYTEGLSLLEHKNIRSIGREARQSNPKLLQLLENKVKFSERLKDLSHSKRIRPRQQSARHKLHDKIGTVKKIKSIKDQALMDFENIDVNNLPRFQVSQREDF